MPYLPLDAIDRRTTNRYEAVIVSGQRARQINADRLAKLEKMLEDQTVEVDGTKVTTLALRDVIAGRVKFRRVDEVELS